MGAKCLFLNWFLGSRLQHCFIDMAYFWSRLTLCGSSVEKKIWVFITTILRSRIIQLPEILTEFSSNFRYFPLDIEFYLAANNKKPTSILSVSKESHFVRIAAKLKSQSLDMEEASNFELEPEMQMKNFVSQCSVNSSVTHLPFPHSPLPLYLVGSVQCSLL